MRVWARARMEEFTIYLPPPAPPQGAHAVR